MVLNSKRVRLFSLRGTFCQGRKRTAVLGNNEKGDKKVFLTLPGKPRNSRGQAKASSFIRKARSASHREGENVNFESCRKKIQKRSGKLGKRISSLNGRELQV